MNIAAWLGETANSWDAISNYTADELRSWQVLLRMHREAVSVLQTMILLETLLRMDQVRDTSGIEREEATAMQREVSMLLSMNYWCSETVTATYG